MSEQKNPKFDVNSPEAQALTDDIVHGTFVKEGSMVAMATCFPGASAPIPADEGRITALDITDAGTVYGGTSGRAAHLFVAMFHGVTGVVFDRGLVENADHCAAICCGTTRFAACVNGPDGGRVVTAALQPLPYDLLQEWTFRRQPFHDLGKVDGSRIIHAVIDDARSAMIGITTDHLFTVDLEQQKIHLVSDLPGSGRVAVGSGGGVFGQDGPRHLWHYNPHSQRVQRRAVALPDGAWDSGARTWARNHRSGLLYTTDEDGVLFSFDEKRGFSKPLARIPLAPAGPMAVTHDGRLFGFCGTQIANLFCYNPRTTDVKELGVAVSVLHRRRYGYLFGDAVTGRDGQIIFGEDDDLGHLWLYFPRIQARD